MFHLWGFWVMAVIFNLPLMLLLSLVASSLAKLVPQTRCNGRWKVMKKGKCSRKKRFYCCRFGHQQGGIPGMSEPEALCASGGRWSTCCRTAASSGKQVWGLPFSWRATCPTASEHPASPFVSRNNSALQTSTKQSWGKKWAPIFREMKQQRAQQAAVVCLAASRSLFFPCSVQG